MNKCEWKDGKFTECPPLEAHIRLDNNNEWEWELSRKECSDVTVERGLIFSHQVYTFCPFCGADIRKTEPTVTIEKSGGTFVAEYKGIDYLVLDPLFDGTDKLMPKENVLQMVKIALGIFASPMIDKYTEIVKPISEIEITDEIAKLRPMVKDSGRDYSDCKLWGVSISSEHAEMLIVTMDDFCYWSDRENLRLATTADLKETK